MENKSKILIISANYYENISKNLNESAIETLNKNGYKSDVIFVPGAFEIPLAIKKFITNDNYIGFVALGCIIKGQTFHFEILSHEIVRSISSLVLKFNKPIGFGVLTCNNISQAEERSAKNDKNKGKEAAESCLKMIKLLSIK